MYKNKTFYIVFLLFLFFISGCSTTSYLYDKQTRSYKNLIYVDSIPEKEGMFMMSQLRSYFNNQDINSAKYILKTQITISEKLQLDNISGFATQGELWITASWQLVDKVTNKVYVSSTGYHPAYYNIMPSSYASSNGKELAINLAIKNLARDMILKVVALLKESKGNFSNFSSTIINNNTAPIHQNEDYFRTNK